MPKLVCQYKQDSNKIELWPLERHSFLDYTNVYDYGARGDGIIDDTTAIQAAITATQGSGKLFFPPGTYVLSQKLTISNSISIEGIPGLTILDISGYADAGIEAAGTKTGTTTTLTSNASEGDTVISVTDASSFSADDWIMLRSTDVTGTASQKKGEILQISSISSNDITLRSFIHDDYTTGTTATVELFTMLEDVYVSGLTIQGGDTSSTAHVGLYFDTCRNIRVENCTFLKTHSIGVRLLDVIGFQIKGNHFEDILRAGYAYGISCGYSCQDGLIEGNTGKRLRHLVTLGGGTTYAGVSRRITVDGNAAYQCNDAGFDCHSGPEDITFSNNTVDESSNDGIVFQASMGSIIGNTVVGADRYAIFAQLCSAKGMDVVIANNKCHGVSQSRGIFVTVSDGTYQTVDSILINGNSINAGSYGIDIYTSQAITIPGVVVSGNSVKNVTVDGITLTKCVGFSVTGNHVEFASTRKGILGESSTDGTISGNYLIGSNTDTATRAIKLESGTDVVISGNRIKTSNKGIFLDDSCDYCVIEGNNARGCTTPFTLGAGTHHIVGKNYFGASYTTTVTAAGPTDDLDVTGIEIIYIDTNSNNVTLGGLTGGILNQQINIVIIDATNNSVIEHAEATGNQDFYLESGGDETKTATYGGWQFVCDGTHWYQVK